LPEFRSLADQKIEEKIVKKLRQFAGILLAGDKKKLRKKLRQF
jgi:hypothetical protein